MNTVLRSLIAIGIFFAFTAALFSPSPARAAITPIPFAWCWKYTSQDGFESNTAGAWGSWGNTVTGTVTIGTVSTSTARSGTGADLMSFANSEPMSGSYLISDRYIDRNLLVKTQVRRDLCTVPKPTASSRLRFCSASVWIKPTATKGAHGSFQLLSWPDYFYLAVSDFDIPASSTGQWQQITIADTTACQDDMVIRLGLDRTSGSIAAVWDDVEIVWAY